MMTNEMMNNANVTATTETAKAPRMTKKMWFAELETIVDNSNYDRKEEIKAFIAHEVELIDKKSNSSKKSLTQTQKENLAIVEEITNVLKMSGKPLTIPEMQEASATLAGYRSQKLSALLHKTMADTIVRTVEKKKAYFAIKGGM